MFNLNLSPIALEDSMERLEGHITPGQQNVLFDLQGLHKLQEIFGFKAKDFGGGGAISLSPRQSFEDQPFSGGVDAFTIREGIISRREISATDSAGQVFSGNRRA
jgi:hypothetical protein